MRDCILGTLVLLLALRVYLMVMYHPSPLIKTIWTGKLCLHVYYYSISVTGIYASKYFYLGCTAWYADTVSSPYASKYFYEGV